MVHTSNIAQKHLKPYHNMRYLLIYSVIHQKYKYRENQKFGFFRNFRLILHENEKKKNSPNVVLKTGFLYFDAPELFKKSSKIKNLGVSPPLPKRVKSQMLRIFFPERLQIS